MLAGFVLSSGLCRVSTDDIFFFGFDDNLLRMIAAGGANMSVLGCARCVMTRWRSGVVLAIERPSDHLVGSLGFCLSPTRTKAPRVRITITPQSFFLTALLHVMFPEPKRKKSLPAAA